GEPSYTPLTSIPLFQLCVLVHIHIQFVEVYVGKYGANDSSLWCPRHGVLKLSIFENSCPQELPEQIQDVFILHSPFDTLHQIAMRYRVKVGSDIALYHPLIGLFASSQCVVQRDDCVHCASAWPESI